MRVWSTLLLSGVLIGCHGAATTKPASMPATQAAADPLPWEIDPSLWPQPDGPFIKHIDQHAREWREYARLAMTPLDDSAAFRAHLTTAIRNAIVCLPDVTAPAWMQYEPGTSMPKPPLRVTPAMNVPDAPLDEATLQLLARDVHEALLYLHGGPFEAQRSGFLAHRKPSQLWPDHLKAGIKEYLHEDVDPKSFTDDRRWDYLRRLYEARRATMGGGVDVVAAALDDPKSVVGCIFRQSAVHPDGDDDRLFALLLSRGQSNYWTNGLIHCGLPVTEPAPTAEELLKRDGSLLRAELFIVLQLRDGDRTPISIMCGFDPITKHWGFESICLCSSPFEAMTPSFR